ncbi:MAG TPA: hypothetical protein VFO29_07525 [Candidatus Rubrimentiphilum sp.]|nr:hypothetical protein [Candidatus Rubrimentiphilum sp.]
MKIARLVSSAFLAALLCATAASAAQTPPPIDMAALQAYAPGTSAISIPTWGATAFCAPDIPYVTWYVGKLNDDNPPAYDPRMQPYTHKAAYVPAKRFGVSGFECTGLAPGRYIVWLENPPPSTDTGVSDALFRIGTIGPQTNIPNNVTHEDGPAEYQAAFPGSNIPFETRYKYRRLPIPPAHVVLGSGTFQVHF